MMTMGGEQRKTRWRPGLQLTSQEPGVLTAKEFPSIPDRYLHRHFLLSHLITGRASNGHHIRYHISYFVYLT